MTDDNKVKTAFGEMSCCQRCIRVSMGILFIFSAAQLIMAIVKYTQFSAIPDDPLYDQLYNLLNDPETEKLIDDYFKQLASFMGLVTIVGMLFACVTLICAKWCYGGTMGRSCTRLWVLLSFACFTAIGVIWIILAVVFFLPGQIKVDMDKNCQKIQLGETADMTVAGQDYSELYQAMIDIDDLVGREVINKYMCSDFCVCPGTPNSAHYKQYQEQTKELEASKRSMLGFDSTEIKFDRFGTDNSPLIWSFDPTTSEPDKFLVELQSQSLLQCLDNMESTIEAFKQKAIFDATAALKREAREKARKQVAEQGGNEQMQEEAADEAEAEVDEKQDEIEAEADQRIGSFGGLKDDLQKNRPNEGYIKLINHIESTYDCSGLCRPPLFYLTVPVTKGPPVRGCAPAVMEALDSMVGSLAQTFVASAVFFFLMIFFVCPICCLEENPPNKNGEMEEGGESELEMNQVQPKSVLDNMHQV